MPFGFNDINIARALKEFVTSGQINTSTGERATASHTRIPASRIFIGTPAEGGITAATGGIAGVNYVCGTGTMYLLELNPDDNILYNFENVAGEWIQVDVNNSYKQAIAYDSEHPAVYPILQDRTGAYWVLLGGGASIVRMGKVATSVMSARSGSTPGSGDVEEWELDVATPILQDKGDSNLTVYNIFNATVPVGTWILFQEDEFGNLIMIAADCP